jgi:hypothetical protein
MISLGICDNDVRDDDIANYLKYAVEFTGAIRADVPEFNTQLRGQADDEWAKPVRVSPSPGELKVRELQQFLVNAGFLPFGTIDGICGYRTTSALRLFQEYVRTIIGDRSIGTPDGVFGPKTMRWIQQWIQQGRKADWLALGSTQASAEYVQWLSLLRSVQKKYTETPNKMFTLVNQFRQPTDTLKVSEWDLDPERIHLIGIRRRESHGKNRKFDDLFVLLIRGMVFKFVGSTDPGATSNSRGMPFLVQGQHCYRFGWHKLRDAHHIYHALRPSGPGVLVVRSKDGALTDADLAGDLERNDLINIHWGGEGQGIVGNWSEGCQVIAGDGYINHRGTPISCRSFAARTYSYIGRKSGNEYYTRGAYTVIEDLVTALSGQDNSVRYMLLDDGDVNLNPSIGLNAVEGAIAMIKG